MKFTYNSIVLAKCPICAKEIKCRKAFKIQRTDCPYCGNTSTLIDYQSEMQMQSQIKKLEDELVNQ
jgi:ribosomal protein L37AE/L43A